MRVAVIGAGVAGVGAAWLLSPKHSVDVYEAENSLGGHAKTLSVTTGADTFPVDCGFMVYNRRTYHNLIGFFERLGIGSNDADMSFSASIGAAGVEWSGTDLNTVFAQRRNLVNPSFLRMIADVLRFSRMADRLLADPTAERLTLGQLLEREGLSKSFVDWYLVPMGAAIWSTPPGKMLDYPASTFLRFCDNHGLLHVTGKPMWLSVPGGSRTYVEAAAASFSGEVHTGESVERLKRVASGVRVHTANRTRDYDIAIIASHPPQTLEMLGDGASAEEREVLSAFTYQSNPIVLHTDTAFMPRTKRAWASWNWYAASGESEKDALALTYWINNLQALPTTAPPVFETLNPHQAVEAARVLASMTLDHPLFTEEAVAAQARVAQIQGAGGIWYAGAWQRYGFHEDGLFSAVRVAESLGVRAPWSREFESQREAAQRGDLLSAPSGLDSESEGVA